MADIAQDHGSGPAHVLQTEGQNAERETVGQPDIVQCSQEPDYLF